MAKTANKAGGIKRQGRRVVPGLRRRTARSSRVAKAKAAAAPLTLGDLIAAAYDAVGGEVRQVAKVLSSADLACAIQRRIVLV